MENISLIVLGLFVAVTALLYFFYQYQAKKAQRLAVDLANAMNEAALIGLELERQSLKEKLENIDEERKNATKEYLDNIAYPDSSNSAPANRSWRPGGEGGTPPSTL